MGTLSYLAIAISIISVLLGAFSVGYALYTKKDLNQKFDNTNQKLKTTTDNINSLCNILNTKPLGIFPENMDEICFLIENANSKIEIFVDYFAYGFYSHPSVFSRYFEILQKKVISAKNSENSFSIDIYCYNDYLLNQVNSIIFNNQTWEKIKDSKKFKNYYNYYKSEKFSNSTAILDELNLLKSKEEFSQYLIDQNRKYINELIPRTANGLPQSKDVCLKKSTSEFPCFLWIKDGDEIILSFSGYGNNSGRCIQTKDTKLLDLVRSELKTPFRYENNHSSA